ncbi:unnamed protein product [Effrenium voratum]|uniref:NAD(P)(+)--arginine ADP-ribosyltransferase n=1 Tax=Effrenium voratum TaxID=2562239 RepID=A0AA36JPC9_9DINO|nr:unnamed protein product [Effrenium voratum]CAJ1446132.1 unnamed protein product [Effrenium voratum]
MQVGKDLGLSEQEVSAVLGWTTGDYRLINPIARGQEEVEFEDYPQGVKSKCRLHRAEVLPYVQVLGSALEKLPPASAARLYRGHRRAVELPPGAVLKMPGFTSVSYDMDSALQFATQANQGRSVKRSLLVFQESFSGRCISKLSARKREVEVLFPVDSCFEVAAAAAAADADAAAEAEKAAEELRKTMPEAEVKVVYLRQVESKEDAVILE